jgi:hypothetical protein
MHRSQTFSLYAAASLGQQRQQVSAVCCGDALSGFSSVFLWVLRDFVAFSKHSIFRCELRRFAAVFKRR